jgi:hypothetical protein
MPQDQSPLDSIVSLPRRMTADLANAGREGAMWMSRS